LDDGGGNQYNIKWNACCKTYVKMTIMKIPTLVMAGLLAVGVSAQTTKPAGQSKKPVKKVKKIINPEAPGKPKPATPKAVVKKDTLVRAPFNCPACGMG